MKGVLGCWDVGIWDEQFWNRFEALRLSLVWSNLLVDSAHPIADHQRSWQLRDALQVGRWAEIGASHSEPKWRIGVQTMWYSGGFQALTNVRTSFHQFSAFYPLQSSCKVSSNEPHKRLQSSSLPKWICCAIGFNFLVPPHKITGKKGWSLQLYPKFQLSKCWFPNELLAFPFRARWKSRCDATLPEPGTSGVSRSSNWWIGAWIIPHLTWDHI